MWSDKPRACVDKILNKKTKQNLTLNHLAHLWYFPLERVAPCSAGPSQNFRLSRQSFPVETTLNRSFLNSIKCLQAISIELCFSISNGTRPLFRSDADDQGQRSLVPVTTFWRLSPFLLINMLPGHSAG